MSLKDEWKKMKVSLLINVKKEREMLFIVVEIYIAF